MSLCSEVKCGAVRFATRQFAECRISHQVNFTTLAPEGSTTVPEIVAPTTCADSGFGMESNNSAAKQIKKRGHQRKDTRRVII
jgi:hypothetical protein